MEQNDRLIRHISPMVLLGEGANRLANEDRIVDVAFLAKQNLEKNRWRNIFVSVSSAGVAAWPVISPTIWHMP